MPDNLINTLIAAPLQAYMLIESWKSWDYYRLDPYPQHAFGPAQWPRDKGPLPTPLPYAQVLINEGAEFLFRNGAPTFSCPDFPDADTLLQAIIKANNLTSQWIGLAENCANHGSIAAKFSIDLADNHSPVRISFLDMPQECRVWADPHDWTRLLMARIQYPFRSLDDGMWYYFREEWTPDEHVTYQRKFAGNSAIAYVAMLSGYTANLGDGDGWVIDTQEPNPFGLIPITVIRNRTAKGNPLGTGDLWHAWRLMDRIALTMHGEDNSNQLHSGPIRVTKNATIENDGPLLPGESVVLQSSGVGLEPGMELLEPTGAAREYVYKSIDKWEDLLYKYVGLSRVDPAEVTNKGNMTALAFAMTYGRTIATSDSKRELWGNSGMARFFSDMLTALKRFGGVREVANIPDDIPVSTEWQSYFEPTDADKSVITDRTNTQVQAGMLPIDRGAERIARAENIPSGEIATLLAELKLERGKVNAVNANVPRTSEVAATDIETTSTSGSEGANN